tara:strand:- start:333 stop:563 length:231 start_codon:yes stop_codon:yes gene_type:complete
MPMPPISSETLSKGDGLRDRSILQFQYRAKTKYDKGQAEHGGYLADRVDFKDLEDEIIDMWFYIQALKEKIRDASL